jgi:hypothetical protein
MRNKALGELIEGVMAGRANRGLPTTISWRRFDSVRTQEGHGCLIDWDDSALKIASYDSQQPNFLCQRLSHNRTPYPDLYI